MASEYFFTVKDLQERLTNIPQDAFVGVQLKGGMVKPMIGLGFGQNKGDQIVIILT